MFVKVPDGASVSAVLARADTEASDGLGVMSMEGQKAWNANDGGDCERAKPEAIDFYKIYAQYYIRRKGTGSRLTGRRPFSINHCRFKNSRICRAGTGRRKGSVRTKRHEHESPKGI